VQVFVGVTDNRWYDFHAQNRPDEVNFWRPRSTMGFRALQPGEPFLFKLHSPQNYIVGGGFFVRHTVLPVSLAWKAFGQKNGMDAYEQFRSRVVELGRRTELDPFIGCTILTQPFFFPRDAWISVPEDWKVNIVVGKGYSTDSAAGHALWEQVRERIAALGPPTADDEHEEPRYGSEFLARARLGQGAFRVLVTDAYHRRCAISGEKTLPVLEAAHIRPYGKGGPHRTSNGLLLRSDLHILYDEGYLTVTKDLRVEVSGKIRDEFENGKHYYEFDGQRLTVVPDDDLERPSVEFLEWHNQYRYAG